MIKYIFALKIYQKENTSFWLIKENKQGKNLNNPHAFIEYSNNIDDVLDDINNYNKNRDKKVLIFFDDMIADVMRSKKFEAIIKQLLIRC